MSKRVKIRPTEGGITTDKRNELSSLLHNHLKIKYSRIVEAGDSFAVVCLDELNVDKLISTDTIVTLKNKRFDLILPPHLRARKCVVVRNLDKELHDWTTDRMLEDLEQRNEWAKIEAVFRMGEIKHMIKIRFQEITMARKACEAGLAFHTTHIATHQIEPEEFIPITPCWNCFKYNHNVKDCPLKETTFCSECAEMGHTFRQCNNPTKKCLNCDGPHRTLAAICPIRKTILKEKREEKKQKKQTFEQENRTYCAVTKMSKELPKTIQNQTPPQTALHVHDKLSLQVLVIVIEAHLHNIVQPGSFNTRLNEILETNNLPRVNIPEPVHSEDIFRVINRMPEYAAKPPTRDVEMEEEEEEDDDDSSSGSLTIDTNETQSETAATQPADSETTTKQSRKMVTLPPKPPLPPRQQQQKQQQQTRQQQQHRQQQQEQQGVRPKERQQRTETSQASGKTVTKSHGSDPGLTFYTYPHSGILETMAPEPLYRNIREGHIKFTYGDERLSEMEVLKYIRDGTLNTSKNKVKTVDESIFRKIRNGLIKGSPKEATQKQRLRYSSQ